MRRAWAALARAHASAAPSPSLARDVVARLPRRRARRRVLGAAALTFALAFLGGYTGFTQVPWRPAATHPVHGNRASWMPIALPATSPCPEASPPSPEGTPPNAAPHARAPSDPTTRAEAPAARSGAR